MRSRILAYAAAGAALLGCRPSDVLSVPPPPGVVSGGSLNTPDGAESIFEAGRYQLFNGLVGYNNLLMWSETLSDEYTWFLASDAGLGMNVDARTTSAGGGYAEGGDNALQPLLTGRSSLLVALPVMEKYEAATNLSHVGEAFALVGYSELLLAEDYCAGLPLSQVLPGGRGIQYGHPLTTDSLLGVAEAHFDSALAHAAGSDTVVNLASIGLARTLLNRARYDSAALVVANVTPGFVYNTDMPPTPNQGGTSGVNLYAGMTTVYGVQLINVSDREGTNGQPFISAHDPRLQFDTTFTMTGAATWYVPKKFENFEYIPLATGIEAGLIQAEAALHNGSGAWLTDLQALRTSAGDTATIADPISPSARVDLLFSERAFWLFGTGTRLGDLRRLIRQYGRDQSTVFPTGTYVPGTNPSLSSPPILTYGTDVNLTLPTGAQTVVTPSSNPYYKGCIDSGA
ncbi:MAG TPA: hypothetical protein VNW46_07210 [Gemmatimonadaceae bacterium]|nr:hypothetical protein [Gemmatimonadaceae bacterium]